MNNHKRAGRWLRNMARPPRQRQQVLPFVERSDRRRRWFKRIIVAITALAATVLIGTSSTGRHQVRLWTSRGATGRCSGCSGSSPTGRGSMPSGDCAVEHEVEQTHEVLTRFYDNTTEEMRELFRVAAMDPEHGLIRWGRGAEAFVISPQVFEPDEHGRSYRMRPDTRSVWLRQITLHHGPFGMFQVLDTPKHRAAAVRTGGIVNEGSVQNTNSWGLRGAEPDTTATVRGIVLGDSFMLAMFNGDGETPTVYLERYLRSAWKVPVSILNTGHIGYSPEQYYFTLCEYGDQMRPEFVVVSVCPNDFGDGPAVLRGEGDWFDEAEYWLDQIRQWCTARSVVLLLVPVPTFTQIQAMRNDAFYPGRVCNLFRSTSMRYCDPLNEFVDEHIRLVNLSEAAGRRSMESELFDRGTQDDHFSPRGGRSSGPRSWGGG